MTDDLVLALRTQMHGLTADDALPPGFVTRVHRGVRRRRQRQLAVTGSAAAVAGIAGVALLAGGTGPGTNVRVAVQPTATAGAVAVGFPGPTDAELRTAEWFTYASVPVQPDVDRRPEQRWEGRGGELWGPSDEEPARPVLYSAESRFPVGDDQLTWEQLHALPADARVLARRLREASGGRPPEELLVDQVAYLLGRTPVLRPVRRALVEAALLQDGVRRTDGRTDSRDRDAFLLTLTDRDAARLELYVDPVSYRLLEQRLVAGPGFPTPPTEGPVPTDQPSYAVGAELYRETYTSFGTSAPPGVG